MPEWETEIRKLLAGLNLAPAREAEIIEELAQHAEDRCRDLQAGGTAASEARRIALQEVSGHQLLAAELRAVERIHVSEPVALGARRRSSWAAGLGQDVRYGFRTLTKSPGFTGVALLALALGIGANTSIFSVVNGVLLRPLSYPDSARLVRIYETTSEYGTWSIAYPNYVDWRRENRSFVNMGVYRSDDFSFTGYGQPEHLSGQYVSESLFPTLGVVPVLGRNFLPEEDRPGAGCAVVLSFDYWSRRFAADPHILGRAMNLNARSCAVVGVMPPGFQPEKGLSVYIPIEQLDPVELHSRESHPGLRVIARLRPRITQAAAQAEMLAISRVLGQQYAATNAGHGARLIPLKDDVVASIRPTLLLLAGAVGFVLLIACANVANLLLARATARRREFAIRAALGADRRRVVRQLLTESLMLSVSAALLGLLLARWGTQLVLAASPDWLPRSQEVRIDPYVLLFTLAVSIFTGLLFGIAPAFHGANANPQDSLKEGTRGSGGGRRRAESVFVILELALAVILLTGAGLMMQSVRHLWQVNPGFNTHSLLTAQVALSPKIASEGPALRLACDEMLNRVAAVPGVRSAAITTLVPLGENDSEIPYWPGAGPQPAPDRMTPAMIYIVTPEYLDVMQIPLRRGRFFTAQDRIGSNPVVVIDEVLAKRVFHDENPIGKQISLILIGPVEVVGVAGHVKHWGLDADDTANIRDQIYFPFLQIPDKFMPQVRIGLALALRTIPEPLSLVPAVRTKVAGPTEDQPMFAVRSMEQIISRSLAERRFAMLLLAIFAGAALLLAAIGIYGVMSYAVSRRTHELGIRAALGASRGEIVAMVLRQGMALFAFGVSGGVLAALATSRLLSGLLYGVRPADPATLAAVGLLLGAITLVACYIPALRATSADPMTALRCE